MGWDAGGGKNGPVDCGEEMMDSLYDYYERDDRK